MYETNTMRSLDRIIIFTLFVLMVWTLVWVKKAYAQEAFEVNIPAMCGNTSQLVKNLKKEYGEEIIAIAPSKNEHGHTLYHSFWINNQTMTWTFTVSNEQSKKTCVIASGEDLQMQVPSIGF